MLVVKLKSPNMHIFWQAYNYFETVNKSSFIEIKFVDQNVINFDYNTLILRHVTKATQNNYVLNTSQKLQHLNPDVNRIHWK